MANLQSRTCDCQVEAEDIGPVDVGGVDPSEGVRVASPVGRHVWERSW